MQLSEFITEFVTPIQFYPRIAAVAGAKATILIGQLIGWHEASRLEWLCWTMDEIQQATGLSKVEQRTARRKLKQLGFLKELENRLEHKMYYQVQFDKIWSRRR